MPRFVDGNNNLVKGTSRRYFNYDTKCYMDGGKCKTLQMRSVPDLETKTLKGNPGCINPSNFFNGEVVCPATGEWSTGNKLLSEKNFCSVPVGASEGTNLGMAYKRDNNVANKDKKIWWPVRCIRNDDFKITERNMIALCSMRRFLNIYDDAFARNIKGVPRDQQNENDVFRTLNAWTSNGSGKTTSDSEYQSLHELRLPLKTPQGGFHQEVYYKLSDGDMYQYMSCNIHTTRLPSSTDMGDIADLVMPPLSALPDDLIAVGHEKIDDLLDTGLWINLPNYIGTNNVGAPAKKYDSEHRYNGLVANGYKGRTHFVKDTLLRENVNTELSNAFMERFYTNARTYFTTEAETAFGLEDAETLTNDNVFKGLKYFLRETLNNKILFSTNRIITAKVGFYESICSRFTRTEVADAPLTSFFRFACSCNLPSTEYIDDQGRNRYREDYTRACDTLCVSSGGAVRSYKLDENNNLVEEKCESSLCVIDNLNISIIDSDVSGGINIEQSCEHCVGASCTCLLSNTNIAAIDSSIEGGINLATVCDRCIESEGRVEDGVEVDCTGTGGGSGELSGDIYQDLSYSNSLYSTAQSVQRYKGTILPVLGALSLIIVLCIVLVIMLSSKSTPYYDLPST